MMVWPLAVPWLLVALWLALRLPHYLRAWRQQKELRASGLRAPFDVARRWWGPWADAAFGTYHVHTLVLVVLVVPGPFRARHPLATTLAVVGAGGGVNTLALIWLYTAFG